MCSTQIVSRKLIKFRKRFNVYYACTEITDGTEITDTTAGTSMAVV